MTARPPRMCVCDEQRMWVWPRDPKWWRCDGCDGRVRTLTPAEKRARDAELEARRV